MAASLADFVTLLNERVDDAGSRLTAAQRNSFVTEAVREYSRHRPRRRMHRAQGDGTFDYALPTDWDRERSVIEEMEFPIPNTAGAPVEQQVREFLTEEDFEIVETTTTGTLRLRFVTATPTTADWFRFRYTVPHTVTDGPPASSTVAVQDDEIVAWYAAGLAHLALAGEYANTTDATRGSDFADFRSKADEHRSLAKDCFDRYRVALGLPRGDAERQLRASSYVQDLDVRDQFARDRLTHPNRWR